MKTSRPLTTQTGNEEVFTKKNAKVEHNYVHSAPSVVLRNIENFFKNRNMTSIIETRVGDGNCS
ncbi:hypothetical protein CA265_12080 [Sphingobacteriaceae bacterium GW460-11-11-14-LB5]|nr:hypothetical protein CA265_12080 [Sphingobacteriaceae bacterium GW460-11-11-14-LB5]